MGGIVRIGQVGAIQKSIRMPQERFSRGGWLLWYPPSSNTRILNGVFAASTPWIICERRKTRWTLPSPAFFFIGRRRKERRTERQRHLNPTSTKSDQAYRRLSAFTGILGLDRRPSSRMLRGSGKGSGFHSFPRSTRSQFALIRPPVALRDELVLLARLRSSHIGG